MTERAALVRIGGRIKQLPPGDTLSGAGEPPPVDALTITYTDARVTGVDEDGVDTTITYNVNGTVDTVSYPRGSLTRTETYTYNTDGTVSGMTAAEA